MNEEEEEVSLEDLRVSLEPSCSREACCSIWEVACDKRQLVGTCDLWTLWNPPVSLNHIYFKEAFCFKQLHVVNVASRRAI
jgi:hypothetical protein